MAIVKAIDRIMRADHAEPINLGTDRLVTINELVDIIADAAGKEIRKDHKPSKL